jgi:hypothetical protein
VNATVTQGAKALQLLGANVSPGLFNTKDDHIILLGMSVSGGRAVVLGTRPARPYNWSNGKCKCCWGPKTLKREDLAPLPEIIKTYYVFIYLDTWRPDQLMLDYFGQRLSCISERATRAATPGKRSHIGLVSSKARV